ncbi:MAG TPA: response regulator transcription factor [Firmicutes bacterium]|nr:response regulator transcription factor [Bacillota bacterium]
MAKTVYLLEDDKSICDLVTCSLELADIEAKSFGTVRDFMTALDEKLPDVCLLDVMLPDGNGFDVLTRIKSVFPNVVCIMLSAMGRENDKVKGLNLGADDYISKPFGVLELTARVNAAFRRLGRSDVLAAGNVEIDENKMTAKVNGQPVVLSNMELRLLAYLIRNAGTVITRDKLLTTIWGYDQGETRTVDIHVARLRKLGVEGIETVFGAGYRFKK